ncbi:MAG: pyridoxamine 5'-phosphate oxidase family protein [Acidimicrobiales bacterium]
MGRIYDGIDQRLAGYLESQPVFFVATAPLDGAGHVNCSPKGNRGELVVLGPSTVAYLDQTGSGVETIAHLEENGRIVLMFCSFDGPPRIVRVHGRGEAVLVGDERFADLVEHFGRVAGAGAGAGPEVGVGVRSVVVVEVDRVADSCGYGVPLMSFAQHRTTMDEWAERKGADGIRRYWAEENSSSLDGLTGIESPSPSGTTRNHSTTTRVPSPSDQVSSPSLDLISTRNPDQ